MIFYKINLDKIIHIPLLDKTDQLIISFCNLLLFKNQLLDSIKSTQLPMTEINFKKMHWVNILEIKLKKSNI